MRATFIAHVDRGPETIRTLAHWLEALTRTDADELAAGGLPHLYEGGIRYKSEVWRDPRSRAVRATERWRDARTVARERVGDCEDLSSYLAACYRLGGIAARAVPFYVRPGLVHCVTVLPDGRIEDPSAVLGMRSLGLDHSEHISEALRVIDGR